MLRFTSLPRPVLLLLAILLAAASTLYSALWMYYVRASPKTQLGINYGDNSHFEYSALARSLRISEVGKGTAAERAGLQVGDGIVAVNGLPLDSEQPFWNAVLHGQPGDHVRLRVERLGARPFAVEAVLLPREPEPRRPTPAQRVAIEMIRSYPVLFLVVGFAVLFLRLHDAHAWLLALLFAGFIGGPPLLPIVGAIPEALRGFAVAYKLTFPGLSTALFYYFFAVFPAPSPLDRRWPWLKHVFLVPTIVLAVPLGAWLLAEPGVAAADPRVARLLSGQLPSVTGPWPEALSAAVAILVVLGGLVLGFVSLIWNTLAAPTAEARRKTRVIAWGTLVGWTPVLILFGIASARGKNYYDFYPFWLWVPLALLTLLFPLSFAYAVLKHRVMEVPQLLRLGLQYALARGFLRALRPAVAASLVADLLLHGDQPSMVVIRARGWLYLVLGALALLAHTRRQRWLEALDRRFFRERYDAHRLLREVVEDVRQAGSFERFAPRVVAKVEAALHPEFVALLVREPREASYRALAAAPAGQAPPALPAESKLLAFVCLLAKPVEIPLTAASWLKEQLPHEETDFLRQARIELLVPVAISPERTEALLALGPKRSEEPYTREDQDLLVTIAASLALLLERPALVPARVSEAFEECPQCGTCYDTGAARCAQDGATLVSVRVPRLLAGRYRMERRLGRGGMGTVYAAQDTALERRVAVKLIRDDLLASADAAERFRREARTVASFTHPNVVTVFDFGLAGDSRAFLVMELLDGTTVREELQRHHRLAARRTVEVLRGVCAAVDAAHRRQLIHRDLKPENIFLVRGETPELAKVLDFGIAKFLPTSTQAPTETGTGLLVGTPYYMAPEQLRGELVSPSWDVWALAVIAYECLTGVHPFAAANPAEFTLALLAGRFKPVAEHLPDAPPSWQDFFARALAPDPNRRPASARTFLAELGEVLL